MAFQQEQDTAFMQLAIDQAKLGRGRTSPNPCVGAVIVKNGVIVGKGFHKKAGTPHAEINAIADAGPIACTGATMYVTLEPCNHTGKTPPCSEAVLAAGVKRVVIGMSDPHDVAHGGAGFLQSQGLDVEIGILEEQCRRLNRPFLKYITSRTPWVVMKAGMSLDGRISFGLGQGGAITGAAAKLRVHELRDRYDAILIGVETALIDDPSLTTRLPQGGRDPLRVILDSRLRLPATAKMLQQDSTAATWIFCEQHASMAAQELLEQAGAVVYRVSSVAAGRLDLNEILFTLGRLDILSVLVEGGAGIHGSFLREDLFDEVFLFVAPYFIGDIGTPLVKGTCLPESGPMKSLKGMSTELVGEDILVNGVMSEDWL